MDIIRLDRTCSTERWKSSTPNGGKDHQHVHATQDENYARPRPQPLCPAFQKRAQQTRFTQYDDFCFRSKIFIFMQMTSQLDGVGRKAREALQTCCGLRKKLPHTWEN